MSEQSLFLGALLESLTESLYQINQHNLPQFRPNWPQKLFQFDNFLFGRFHMSQ